MSTTVSGTPRFALAFAIMAAVPALSQTASAAAPAKTAAQAATPSASVIPLPLNPVIPAAQRLCSTKAASGLGSMTLKAAEGAKPAKADYVLVNYIGYLSA
ncbi:MAG: hypothetical protein ACOVKV_17165, partial [Novosphingobium sp.]